MTPYSQPNCTINWLAYRKTPMSFSRLERCPFIRQVSHPICTFYVQLTGPEFKFLGHYFYIHESITRKRIDSSNLGTDSMRCGWNNTCRCRIPEFPHEWIETWKLFLERFPGAGWENPDLRHSIIYINSGSPLSLSLSHPSALRIPSNSPAYCISCQMSAAT